MVLQYTTPRVKTFSLLSCRKLIGNRNCGDEYNTYIHTYNKRAHEDLEFDADMSRP